ncbi:MAG: hypothetical protein FWB74_09475 [Defluviitaleaceae bacterium]|nr:hypothetical protein [Defluviitaleaceae bacterium]
MNDERTCPSAAKQGCSGCPSAGQGCGGGSGVFGGFELPEAVPLEVPEGEKPDLLDFLLTLPDVDE